MNWYAIINQDNCFWMGEGREYSTHLQFAKLFTEEEKELSFVFPDESWYLIPNNGDA